MKLKTSLSKKVIPVLSGMLFSITASFAQTTTANTTAENPALLMNPTFYLVAAILLILIIIVLALSKTVINLSRAFSANKNKLSVILLLFMSSSAFSQAEIPVAEKTNEIARWMLDPDVYILGLLFFIILLTIYVLYMTNMKLIKALYPEAFVTSKQAVEGVEGVAAAEKKPSFFRRVYLRLVDSVPVEHEKDVMLDHDYDGIRELDNNLPPWWKYGFYVTIIFAVIYMFIYHVSGTGKLQGEEYKDELLLAQKQKEERLRASADNVNEENVTALIDAETLGKGKDTYQKLCVACHLANGGGQVGPNLTDEYWLHGGGIKNIFKTITYGVPNKGMISWQSQLSPKQIQQVSCYILTFKGTNPAGAKDPQGDKWVEENTAPADSSAKANTDSATVASAETVKK